MFMLCKILSLQNRLSEEKLLLELFVQAFWLWISNVCKFTHTHTHTHAHMHMHIYVRMCTCVVWSWRTFSYKCSTIFTKGTNN